MIEDWRSNRWFRQRTDEQLVNGEGIKCWGVNAGRANREMRRRAAISGLGVYDWIAAVKGVDA